MSNGNIDFVSALNLLKLLTVQRIRATQSIELKPACLLEFSKAILYALSKPSSYLMGRHKIKAYCIPREDGSLNRNEYDNSVTAVSITPRAGCKV